MEIKIKETSELQEFEKELILEHDNLKVKIERLRLFMNAYHVNICYESKEGKKPPFSNLDYGKVNLLEKQLAIMQNYSDVLERRLFYNKIYYYAAE